MLVKLLIVIPAVIAFVLISSVMTSQQYKHSKGTRVVTLEGKSLQLVNSGLQNYVGQSTYSCTNGVSTIYYITSIRFNRQAPTSSFKMDYISERSPNYLVNLLDTDNVVSCTGWLK